MRILMVMFLVACSGGKEPPVVPDYGPEAGGKDDSATRPATSVPISYGQLVRFGLGDGVNWRAWVFNGTGGQKVDAFAQGLDDTDTILYLYKISRITGRPYGKPLGYNDDTDETGWSLQKAPFNPYSSSVTGVVLPEDRDYAAVVTSYHQTGGTALLRVVAKGAVTTGVPSFPGANTPTHIVFTADLDGKKVLEADEYPVSAQLQAALRGGLQMSAAIYKADPDALAAVMENGSNLGMAYGLLYGANNVNTYDASWTPVTAATATDELVKAWGDEAARDQSTLALKSMFKDAAFRASDVDVYRIHWDNGDDTNAEGIVAVKTTTGEFRVFSIVNPA